MGAPLFLAATGLLLLAAPSTKKTSTDLGARMVIVARRSIGVAEIPPGSNRSPEIDAWLQEVGAGLGAQWCAAFVSYVMRQACKELSLAPIVAGGARAKGLMQQFQTGKRWWTAAEVRSRKVPPGSVLVWDRSEPAGSGPQGHTGVLESDNGATMTTIEGNTPWETVARRKDRRKDEPRLLGAGLVHALAPVAKKPSTKPSSAPMGPAGPFGVPPTQPTKPTQPTQPPKSPQSPSAAARVLVIGDSLGVGLAQAMKPTFPPPDSLASSAQVSTTIEHWAAPGPLAAAMFAHKPTVVLCSLGTNDMAGAGAGDAAKKRALIETIVDAVRWDAGVPIAWIMPPTMPFQDVRGLRALLRDELRAQGIPAFESDQVAIERGGDGIHPTPAGYAAWGALIRAWMQGRHLA